MVVVNAAAATAADVTIVTGEEMEVKSTDGDGEEPLGFWFLG